MTGSPRWQLCFSVNPRTLELSTFERHQSVEVSPEGGLWRGGETLPFLLEEEQEQQELRLLNSYQ